MKNLESKAVEFLYQDTQIHFLLSQGDNVMVNATEMAKAFGKRTDVFLKTESVKQFINAVIQPPNGGQLEIQNQSELISNRGRNGIYFNRMLAIKFAAWLDPVFEVWIYRTTDKILFGNYKIHWDAHIRQEDAKERMEISKKQLLLNANQDDAIAYFKAENDFKTAKSEKQKAISNQYRLFEAL
jgi:hypothetical protein